MKSSIKHKLTVFILLLLVGNILIVSFMSLNGILNYQQSELEYNLREDSKTANLYIREQFLKQMDTEYRDFYLKNGERLCSNLRNLIGNDIALYDMKGGNLLGTYNPNGRMNKQKVNGYDSLMTLALDNKIVYKEMNDNKIVYLAPIYDFDNQIGVVRLVYDRTQQRKFYNKIKYMYLIFGCISISIVFVIARLIMMRVMNNIKHLTKSIELVETGKFESVEVINTGDEIQELSKGIKSMASTISENINGIKNEKQKLQRLINKLRELEKKQKSFIGNITHEFKTPITVIKAHLDLAMLYDDDLAMVESSREIILKELERLDDMVENILYLSSIEKYDYEFKQERFDVSLVIKDIVYKMNAKADKYGISIRMNLVEESIFFDRDSFMQIMINLIDNGIKYNKSNGEICISSRSEEAYVIITVEDTGMGIPEELREKIFDPFYTVDKNRTKTHSGTGLGLPIVASMLRKQGGSIEVEAGEVGSRFKVYIKKECIKER